MRGESKSSTAVASKSLSNTSRAGDWLGKKTRSDEMKMKDIDRIASNAQRKRQVSSRFVGSEGDDLKALPLLVDQFHECTVSVEALGQELLDGIQI
ncbi:unnamed protein product [Echinostoma caproni]|uniref:Ribosome assembly protein 3 n=1 Tax=Echinostoma caproni TaxID=27848 RepID=A0A183B4L3_9TREM|nr:unnamed protein product [Echinostoma caproni]